MSRRLLYPKIPDSRNFPLGECYAFEKYDGTNVHFAWDRDFGWHAFGTRRDQFNLDEHGIQEFAEQHPELADLSDLFQRTLAEPLETVLRSCEALSGTQEILAFAEYFGPRSFAGRHATGDARQLVLFDVLCDGEFLGPQEFVEHFSGLPIARVIYKGRFTGAFAEDVRQGRYPVTEGVVCKSGSGKDLRMAKIKTITFRERLKQAFADRWEDYWE